MGDQREQGAREDADEIENRTDFVGAFGFLWVCFHWLFRVGLWSVVGVHDLCHLRNSGVLNPLCRRARSGHDACEGSGVESLRWRSGGKGIRARAGCAYEQGQGQSGGIRIKIGIAIAIEIDPGAGDSLGGVGALSVTVSDFRRADVPEKTRGFWKGRGDSERPNYFVDPDCRFTSARAGAMIPHHHSSGRGFS